MEPLRQGSRGRRVSYVQLSLNCRLVPTPSLRPDGLFGPKTQRAVIAFQRQSGQVQDGVVGEQTWKWLTIPTGRKTHAPNLARFSSAIGEMEDFIHHVKQLESVHRRFGDLMTSVHIADFGATGHSRRFLLTKGGSLSGSGAIIDFRHFFAAASEAFAAGRSQGRPPLGGTRGDAVLLGLLFELTQCLDEATRSRLQSCFSREDLMSNRLGAEFGRTITIAESTRSKEPVSQLLRRYLVRLHPVSLGSELQPVIKRLPSPVQVPFEGVVAMLIWLYDAAIPAAY